MTLYVNPYRVRDWYDRRWLKVLQSIGMPYDRVFAEFAMCLERVEICQQQGCREARDST